MCHIFVPSLEEVAERVLTEERDSFDREHGTTTPLPDLEVTSGRAHDIPQDDYKVMIGSEGFRNPDGFDGEWSQANLSVFFERSLKHLYEASALGIARDSSRDLLQKYNASLDLITPEIKISDVDFEPLDSEGAFDRHNNVIKLDTSLMRQLNPKTLEITGDRFEFVAHHEAVHSLWYNSHPTHRGFVDEYVAGETDDYRSDVRRAPVEAIAVYEGHVSFPNKIPRAQRQAIEALRNPWVLPELDISPEGYYDEGPYTLGAMGAAALEEKIKSDGKSKQEAIDGTRSHLLKNANPRDLQRNIDFSLNERGIENYPQMFQQYVSGLTGSEDRGRLFREEMRIMSQNIDDELSLFLTTRALTDAYRLLNPQK